MILQYDGSVEHDILIEMWYHTIRQNGDLERLFPTHNRSLSRIFALFAAPTHVILDLTETMQIRLVAWFEPTFQIAMSGLWVAQEHRHTKAALLTWCQLLDTALSTWGSIIGVTKQEILLSAHRKLGYNVYGPLPHAFDGQDAWICVLTRDGFEQGVGHVWRRWQKQQQQRHAREPLPTTL